MKSAAVPLQNERTSSRTAGPAETAGEASRHSASANCLASRNTSLSTPGFSPRIRRPAAPSLMLSIRERESDRRRLLEVTQLLLYLGIARLSQSRDSRRHKIRIYFRAYHEPGSPPTALSPSRLERGTPDAANRWHWLSQNRPPPRRHHLRSASSRWNRCLSQQPRHSDQ